MSKKTKTHKKFDKKSDSLHGLSVLSDRRFLFNFTWVVDRKINPVDWTQILTSWYLNTNKQLYSNRNAKHTFRLKLTNSCEGLCKISNKKQPTCKNLVRNFQRFSILWNQILILLFGPICLFEIQTHVWKLSQTFRGRILIIDAPDAKRLWAAQETVYALDRNSHRRSGS